MKLNVVFVLFSLMALTLAEDVELDVRCPSVNGDEVAFLQHNTDCNSYYVCDNGWRGQLLS